MKRRFLRRIASKIAEKVGLDADRVETLRTWIEPAEEREESVPPPAPASTPPPSPIPPDAVGAQSTGARSVDEPTDGAIPDRRTSEAQAEPEHAMQDSGEPIPTRTMARVYASQGHVPRAIAILEQLRATHPEDPSLEEDLGALHTRDRGNRDERQSGVGHEPPAATAKRSPEVSDLVVSAAIDPSTLRISWQITETSLRAAQSFLDRAAAPTLRIVSVSTSDADEVHTITTDHRDVDRAGTRAIGGLPPGASVFAAFGVALKERFHAIAHAPAVRLPYDRPAPVEDFRSYLLPRALEAERDGDRGVFSVRRAPSVRDIDDVLRRGAIAGPESLRTEVDGGAVAIRGAASSDESGSS